MRATRDTDIMAAATSMLKPILKPGEANAEKVLAAVRTAGCEVRFAHPKLQVDRAIVLAAVQQDGHALAHAANFRDDPEVVLAAVSQNGFALGYASPVMQANRAIVEAAVKQAGGALRFASNALCADRELVLLAIADDAAALRFVSSPSLRADRTIVRAAVRRDERAAVAFTPIERLAASDKEIARELQAAREWYETPRAPPRGEDRSGAASPERSSPYSAGATAGRAVPPSRDANTPGSVANANSLHSPTGAATAAGVDQADMTERARLWAVWRAEEAERAQLQRAEAEDWWVGPEPPSWAGARFGALPSGAAR